MVGSDCKVKAEDNDGRNGRPSMRSGGNSGNDGRKMQTGKDDCREP